MVRGLDLQPAAQALVNLACLRQGRDNITVVLMLVPWEKTQPKEKESKFWLWAPWGLAGLFLLALAMVGLIWVIFRFILPPGSVSAFLP
jgi:hypothetical protein